MHIPQRHCLILQGENDWLDHQAGGVYLQADEGMRCWLSDQAKRPNDAISTKQALQHLGRSNQLIIFDGRDHFSADAFGALIGTLKAGGWILVLLPKKQSGSLWLQRFLKVAERYYSVQHCYQSESLPEIVLPSYASSNTVTPTQEQTFAIEAVMRVVSGHRRRPLVITSDRGRGKTALLGMAAASLLSQGKTRIIITAPAISNIQPLLAHAAMALPDAKLTHTSLQWQHKEIRFVAPDALLTEKITTDLLIIDEAAAIPVQMLDTMLKAYSRIVFSTTEYGYEGTGRGFAVRFKKTLEQLTPNWRSVTLSQPVRWAEDDALEQFSFDALLLDAEPANERELASLLPEQAEFELLNKQQLANDEPLLREVFGLMVLAHYRTRPSDFQMLLDNDDISVFVLRFSGHIIASAWLVREQLDEPQLARQVFDGNRRLKGHLLPQTLLAHSGVLEAAVCRYQRVIRIAVHPALQGQGLGSRLLKKLNSHYQGHCDVIGTSFALDADLLRFWFNNDYLPVRLGQQADEVSGQRAGILLHALSEAGERVVTQAQQILNRAWPFLLLQSQRELNYRLVILLSQRLPIAKQSLTEADEQKRALASFAYQQRAFESIEPLLWQWLQARLMTDQLTQLAKEQQAVLIKKVLQGQSFSQVADALQLTGRKAIIQQLRQAVADLLKTDSE